MKSKHKLQPFRCVTGEPVDGEVDTMVSDGVNSVGPIIFKARSQEVTVRVLANRILNVFPLLRRVITPEHLRAECSDSSRQVCSINRSRFRTLSIISQSKTFTTFWLIKSSNLYKIT